MDLIKKTCNLLKIRLLKFNEIEGIPFKTAKIVIFKNNFLFYKITFYFI
jgi:hypothetical protein